MKNLFEPMVSRCDGTVLSDFRLDSRTGLSDTSPVKGTEFLRKVKKLGRARSTPVEWVAERGKGSHGTLYFGNSHTVVRNLSGELKTGTLAAMLKQIGLTLSDQNNP